MRKKTGCSRFIWVRVRDVRDYLFETLGPDTGGDICNHYQDHLTPLQGFLNKFEDRLKVILYCLDPTHQPLLATLTRAFGEKVRLDQHGGSVIIPSACAVSLNISVRLTFYTALPEWFSDSRKLLSYGSRFEMFRRVLADVLGEMAEMEQAPLELLTKLAVEMSYNGPKKFFNL